VIVRHDGVWAGDTPDIGIVLQMLDGGIRSLTGIPEALAVWRTLFGPDERVLLKVNCISAGGPTHPAVTQAVAQRLQDAGVRAENILVFDRNNGELASAGYSLNEDGDGVRCHGHEKTGTGSPAALREATVHFFKEMDSCDALINLPIPKQHDMAGVSVSLKNHYGSVDRPWALHGDSCAPGISELNAQPTIQDKTRLVVAAGINVSPSDWERPTRDNALVISFDPVALDTVCRDILVDHRQAQGLAAGSLVQGARHLHAAQALDLGATEAHLIDLREVTLG
jgi:hypothetical protein